VLLEFVVVAAGIAALWWGGDQFVIGAARVASVFRVSPVVVGAVLVGFGTSAPELLVSGVAAARGDMNLGVGNIIGSNLANLTLVLGVAAIIATIPATRASVRREAPLSLGAMLLFAILVQGDLTKVEGAILAVALVVSLAIIMGGARDDRMPEEVGELIGGEVQASRELMRTAVGLVVIVGGAWFLVWGAVGLADRLGLSGGFVGFTLVAIGTSLPELVTAAAAARHGESELVLGNLLGSNLFNSLAVGATIALVGTGDVTDARLVVFGSIAMVIVAAVMWVFIITDRKLKELEGIILLSLWVATLPFVYSPAEEDAQPAESLTRSSSV
jgi:cation:H+ antiporter